MALSHILWRYVREERLKGNSLVLTHVHHGVRKESDNEAHLVQKMAEIWKIPCLVHRFDAKGYAKTMGQSFQEAAREWRYARWQEDMRREGCTLLATAHHLGDQAETILYRLLRGSGTAGLAGIYPAKESIVRPLLTFRKADILNYCAREALPYALDRSNEEPVYIRNRIRLELLPALERDYNPRLQEALGRTGELLRWDEEYLTLQMEAAWKHYYISNSVGAVGLSRDVFSEPAAILSRLLRRAAMLITGEPRGLGYSYVEKIMDSEGRPGWRQDLPGMTVEISNEGIWFSSNAIHKGETGDVLNIHDLESRDPPFPEIVLNVGHWSEISNLKLEIGLWEDGNLSLADATLDRNENKMAVFSRDLLSQFSDQLVCRTRRQGDKMWFQGLGHKSIKKIFQEGNISIKVRNKLPLVAVGAEVLWIPGVRQSGLCPAAHSTKRIYCVLRPQAPSSI
ncbi:tRNA(Ile)-lysidine synthase [Candidatus Desulfosporosinus infrequens]|uniref:tRNA(Ile)-lysidine synthase n=1 Tax=Candidatus Desulfosporosinus infrequens TaxID=2043169 RepID=A0A2U3LQI2_9FIRM|nr:tRNA(Ile)-lysidine synthase [Candidatus Desulfosporosinus infrequens]